MTGADTRADGRLRLTILGGYLGSGKTTWLRHQLYHGRFGRAHILVNEAAETPVDDTLLQQHAAGMTLLAGGCACCAGQPELLKSLRHLCDHRSRVASDSARLERIVLETSGLADPGTIAAAIQADPMLVHHILLDEIIVLADAVNIIHQLGTEHLGRAQIEAADRIILTKVDAQLSGAFSAVYATLSQLNPGASITSAVKGEEIDPSVDKAVSPIPLPALGELADLAAIEPTRLKIDNSVDWAAFSVWLSALLHARGNDIVRVKGVFDTPAGFLLLQGVRNSVQAPEILPSSSTQRANEIVFIGRNFAKDDLGKSLEYFSLRTG
ncbi:GTP-binding protein [Rhodobacteraceae bacterium B1Z28]|uniref:GTP-binding protein n=1 Tax=Ruegeria haliotis TaxID=2747601 RepID=A0ABX2PZZ3_9RHOB|nr:CobW family GTP-binding protein [Ruegeria haliotis]NVO58579.1 GTP-binding protein [Ruegeria haliotis]